MYESPVLLKRIDFISRQVIKESAWHKEKLEVLDMGCGVGTIPYHLGSLGFNVTGTDFDPVSIADCKKNNKYPNVQFAVGNAENMDLNHRYDVVIATEIIEHVHHPKLVVETINRHLKDGGIGIVSVPNGYCLWEMVISRFIQKSVLTKWIYNSPKFYKVLTGGDTPFNSKNSFCFHINFFSYWAFKRLLEDGGFKIRMAAHPSLGILPEWSFCEALKKMECKISDHVPHALAGGWTMVVEKNE